MRLDDYPPRARARIVAAMARDMVGAAGQPVRPAAARSRPARPAGRPQSHQCETCGATFAGYPTAESHVDGEHGHGRIGLLL